MEETSEVIVKFEKADTVQDYAVYVIEVSKWNLESSQQGAQSFMVSWFIKRRFSDFVKLHQAVASLTQNSTSELVALPAKRVTGNLNPEFIASRMVALQNYCDHLVTHPIIRLCPPVRVFFDPQNYSHPFEEINCRNVTTCFRGVESFEVGRSLGSIGWRVQKQHFQVIDRQCPKQRKLGSWTDYGINPSIKGLSPKIQLSISKSLQALKHPNIYPVDYCEFHSDGAIFIQPFAPIGSARDVLGSVKPAANFWKKQFSRKTRKGLSLDDLRISGRQLLLALQFLHDKGLAHGNLHTGNVLVGENNQLQLIGLESYFLGLTSRHRAAALELTAPTSSLEALDVFSFGHLMYELSVGYPLAASREKAWMLATVDKKEDLSPKLDNRFRDVLYSLLGSESCKNQITYPKLKDLIEDPFFKHTQALSTICNSPESWKPHLKFSSATKEALAKLKEDSNKKLAADHIKVMTLRTEEKRSLSIAGKFQRRQKLVNRVQSYTEDLGQAGMSKSNQPSSIAGPPLPPPPPPPSPPKAPPPPPPPVSQIGENGSGCQKVQETNKSDARNALLGSITSFNKGALRRCETVDKSGPAI